MNLAGQLATQSNKGLLPTGESERGYHLFDWQNPWTSRHQRDGRRERRPQSNPLCVGRTSENFPRHISQNANGRNAKKNPPV